jgi:signal peptidase I
MPNISSSQGMGQYRYDKNYSYITNKTTFGIDIIDSSVEPPTISKSFDIKPTYRNQGDSIVFRDIQIPLTSNIQYGKTYYLHLDLPQHIQYTTTVKVKLCTYDTSNGTSHTNASLVDFQTIRELIIPPAPAIADQDAIEDILLYVDPISSNKTSPLNLRYQADIIYD